jgi:hypothetical protein
VTRRGGRIGAKATSTQVAASGIWNLYTAQQETGANAWPKSIVRRNLVLQLDAANPVSYPGSGTTWYDLSGNGLNATFTNGTPNYGSVNGGRIEFGANTVYAQVASSSLFAVGTGDFTIELWVMFPSEVLAYGHLFGLPDQASNRIFKTDSSSANNLYFYDGTNSLLLNTVKFTIPNYSWRHVVLSRSSGVLYGYTDGDLRGSVASTVSLSSNSVRIRPFINTEYKATYFSACYFYNTALTATEITHNYGLFVNRLLV